MKQRKNKIVTLMLAGLLTFSLAACGSTEDESEARSQARYEEVKADLETGAETLTNTLTALTDAERESYKESTDSFTVAAVEAWEDVMDEAGELVQIQSVTSENDEDNYTATVLAECSENDVEFVYTYDKDTGAATSIAVNVEYSLATNMQRAGMNTIMGLGIVFLVLIFLCFIISLFKHVNKAVSRQEKKEEPVKAAPAPAPVAEIQEEDLTDDLELVAVITAAIAASQQTSADGFVVRSIKKANRSKWQRA